MVTKVLVGGKMNVNFDLTSYSILREEIEKSTSRLIAKGYTYKDLYQKKDETIKHLRDAVKEKDDFVKLVTEASIGIFLEIIVRKVLDEEGVQCQDIVGGQ